MFLSVEAAADQIADRFAGVGRGVAAWPVRPGATVEEIDEVESLLTCSLPLSFRTLIQDFDFLNSVAGNVAMTLAHSLREWLVVPNIRTVDSTRLFWWRSGPRPVEFLLLGSSDAHIFLLGLATGEIYCLGDDDDSRTPVRVAATFEQFYCGLTSVYLAALGGEGALHEASLVQVLTNADPRYDFWNRFAQRAA